MDEDRSGALGCGCALPLGLVLGLIAFALVGTMAGRPQAAAAAPAKPLTVALSEAYLGQAVAAMIADAPSQAWQLDLLPDNQLALQGMVAASFMGTEMSLPVKLTLAPAVVDGRVEFTLVSAELPGGIDAATAAGMVSPLLTAAGNELQSRLAAALGPGWRVVGVTTSDTEMTLSLEEGAQS